MKNRRREQLQRAIEDYLKRGGVITHEKTDRRKTTETGRYDVDMYLLADAEKKTFNGGGFGVPA